MIEEMEKAEHKVGCNNWRHRAILCFAFGAVVCTSFMAIFRLTNFGVLTYTAKEEDLSNGLGLAFRREWAVWNLWFTPLNIEILRKNCACLSANALPRIVQFGRRGKIELAVTGNTSGGTVSGAMFVGISRGDQRIVRRVAVKGRPKCFVYVAPDCIRATEAPGSVPWHVEMLRFRFSGSVNPDNVRIESTNDKDIRYEWYRPSIVGHEGVLEALLRVSVRVVEDDYFRGQITIKTQGFALRAIPIYGRRVPD